ncbi:MAG: PAS domain S-box protein [Cytophagaceae bacterium]
MSIRFSLLRNYAEFLLTYHLDELINDFISKAREFKLPILNQFTHLSDNQIFDLAKKGFAEDILIPLSQGLLYEKIAEKIDAWKRDAVLIPRDKISGSDITDIYHIRKLALIEMLRHYDYNKEQGIALLKEIETYFLGCINIGYKAYQEIQNEARLKAEDKLQQQLRIFDTALSNTVDFNYIFDTRGRFIYANKPLLNLWKKSLQEVIGKTFKDLEYPENLVKLHNRQINEVLQTRQNIKGENSYTDPEGNTGYYQYVFVPVFNNDGEVEAITGTTHDITELKEAAEEQYKRIFESTNDAIIIFDEKGCVVEVNPSGYKMHGFTYEEMIGMDGRAFVAPEDLPVFYKFIEEVKLGKPFFAKCTHIKKDGKLIYVEKTGASFFFRGKQHLMAILHDVTETRKAEDALKESEDRFRTMADNIPNLAWIANPDGYIFWYNKRWYEYTGTGPHQMEGWGWQSVHHPDVLPHVMQEWKKSLSSGNKFEMIFPIKGADNIYRPFLTRVYPVKDNFGNIIRWFGTNTDVSEVENKNKELRKINADLDNFIYTASHDLKAPVANIEGLLYTLKEVVDSDTKNNAEFREVLNMIESSISRFKNTILDLTEISKIQKQKPEDISQIDCSEIIEDVKFVLNDQIKDSGAEISINVEDCKLINFSRKNFQSIIYNLLSNAIKYRHPDRKPIIEISAMRNNGYVVLTVKDNGLGISRQHLPKLFTMFKRFHSHVEGTGIGLYIIKRIVDNAGGKIEVESKEAEGSEFRVFFPHI